MIPADVRALIAALGLAHASGRSVTGLYDHAQARHLNLTASASGTLLNAIDLDRKAKVSGTLPDLFDHARNSHIHFTGEAGTYIGYDHQSGTHFNVQITADSAAVYDHAQAAWSQYSA